jgi:hypothetical protein
VTEPETEPVPETETERTIKPRTIRIAVLTTALLITILYAVGNVRARARRTQWQSTLEVAVVLVGEAAPDAIAKLQERVAVLSQVLESEKTRHLEGVPPFHFRVFGPALKAPPMPEISDDGVLGAMSFALRSYRASQAINALVELSPGSYDSIVYVYIAPAVATQRAMVEGNSEQGGKLSFVRVELDAGMVDTALFVVTHELFHTLGATDKYDSSGKTQIPQGLPEPERTPLYPQRFAEVMARNRVLSATKEVIPDTLSELAVGYQTAREIGWSKR